jgi:hypothetical protein
MSNNIKSSSAKKQNLKHGGKEEAEEDEYQKAREIESAQHAGDRICST